MMKSVTVHMPEALYDRLQRRAEQTHRTVEDALLEAAVTVTSDEELPPELVKELDALALLDDTALWRAARSRFPVESSEELEALNHKRQREHLSAVEEANVARLLHDYGRTMLVRAQAAVLLKERGHDISVLLDGA